MNEQQKDSLYKELGKNIKKFRVAAQLNQDELSKRLDLSRTSIVNIEQGRQHPPIHIIWEIAESLEVSIGQLLPEKLQQVSTNDQVISDFKKFITSSSV